MIASFFKYAQERYRIHLARETGRAKPWTDDPILRRYRFCNIFREDDTVTKWIEENLRSPISFGGHRGQMVFAMAAARYINRISSLTLIKHQLIAPLGEEIKGTLRTTKQFNWLRFRLVLETERPLVGAAYMIKTPNGLNKIDGIIAILRNLEPLLYQPDFGEGWSLQRMQYHLTAYPFIGGFMAYEIVSDLRHTDVLNGAPDINSWANFGPGAARGMARIYGHPLDTWKHSNPKHQEEMLKLAHKLLGISRQKQYWPREWPQWEMREVEHTLCEFDKYERTRLGEGTPKQKYKGE